MIEQQLPHVRLQQVRLELQRVIVGQDRVIDRLLTSVLAEGHCLLEGVPDRQDARPVDPGASSEGRSRGSSSRQT
jgi:MoxR-like ATPase